MGVEPSWLAARAAADDVARRATVETLLPPLVEQLAPQPGNDVRLIDIGAGCGANQRWLAPRLPFGQRWVHLDHDPVILQHTHDVAHTELVIGGIEALTDLLDRDRGPTVITCAAVLDVLSRTELGLLCDLIIGHGLPALLSLTVTGRMTITPPDGSDAVLLAAFNAHQRRDGRVGPDAPDLVTMRCRAAGAVVASVETPWLLDRSFDQAFLSRFLTERVAASIAHDPSLADAGARWLRRRLADRATRVVVGHRDLLVLPTPCPELSESQHAITC